ncbi:hypothetical protein MMC34_005797 [Xylographa carneopallida]|nr:hypothetical protein [Xylographa carneopallida]
MLHSIRFLAAVGWAIRALAADDNHPLAIVATSVTELAAQPGRPYLATASSSASSSTLSSALLSTLVNPVPEIEPAATQSTLSFALVTFLPGHEVAATQDNPPELQLIPSPADDSGSDAPEVRLTVTDLAAEDGLVSEADTGCEACLETCAHDCDALGGCGACEHWCFDRGLCRCDPETQECVAVMSMCCGLILGMFGIIGLSTQSGNSW